MDTGAVVAVATGVAVAVAVIAFEMHRTRKERRAPPSSPGARLPPRTGAHFARMFANGAVFDDGRGAMRIELATVATLHLPSGQIVACDPLVFPETPAFARHVPPGDYPVEVSVARLAADHVRVAAARVVLAPDAAPVRWELAAMPGEDAASFGPDEFRGYGVDAGLGCFMDAETVQILLAAQAAYEASRPSDDPPNYYDGVLARELERPARDWTDHRPDPLRPHNVAVVHSGWGDGVYASYWGLDAAGSPVVLLTDFRVV